jgi:hypothetical protein
VTNLVIKKIIRSMLEWNTKKVVLPAVCSKPDNEGYIQIEVKEEEAFAE